MKEALTGVNSWSGDYGSVPVFINEFTDHVEWSVGVKMGQTETLAQAVHHVERTLRSTASELNGLIIKEDNV